MRRQAVAREPGVEIRPDRALALAHVLHIPFVHRHLRARLLPDTPGETIVVGMHVRQYYRIEPAHSAIQQQGGLDPTGQFARLFMAPGMQHCIGTGPGPNIFDPLTPLIDWVEKNVEPKRIVAAHFQDNDPSTGVVTRTMPLCPYPKTAFFKGGDVNLASNWGCHRAAE